MVTLSILRPLKKDTSFYQYVQKYLKKTKPLLKKLIITKKKSNITKIRSFHKYEIILKNICRVKKFSYRFECQ